MKNYLCINGKKTELTTEQMKQLGIVKEPIAELNGDIAKIGEYEFIVLKNDGEKVELILKNTLGKDVTFGDTNDFRTSNVKKILDKFAGEISKLVGEENVIEHTVDLTALDGLKCYGSIQAKMSLLTLAQYREYVEKLDEYKCGNWWWLATAWSTPKHNYETSTTCVSPVGNVNVLNGSYYDNGVRPFCVLKSCIFESM